MYKNKNQLLYLILGMSFLSINFVSAMEVTSASKPSMDVPDDVGQLDAGEEPRSVGDRLASVLTSHPRVEKARGSVCEASFTIAEKRAAYFPKLNMSLSGGDKLVDETTRGDAFGGENAPEYDGKGVDLTLSLSQRIYDWGMTSADVTSAKLTRGSTSFQGSYVLQNQIFEFYNSAFDHLTARGRLEVLEAAAVKIRDNVDSIEVRYKRGASRLSDLRAGQVILLDLEMAITAAQNQSALTERVLKTQFKVDGEFVEDAGLYFLSRRPEIPEIVPSREALNWRILDSDHRANGYEIKRLKAMRLPSFTGSLVAKAWDISEAHSCGDVVASDHADAAYRNGEYRRYSNCNTHEVTARLEMSMPLFDGGLNKSQRRRANARARSLEADMAGFDRYHTSESRRTRDNLMDLMSRISNQDLKKQKLREQFDSQEIMQNQIRSNLVSLARLHFDLALAEAEYIGLKYEAEKARVNALVLSDQILDILDVSWESGGC